MFKVRAIKQSLVTSLGFFLIPALAQAESIKLVIQEFAPFTYTDPKTGEIKGFLVDKVIEIMKRAGETPSVTSTSLARGLNATMNEENTCLFGFRRTPERESFYKWVGPLTTDNWVLYTRKDDTRVLKHVEDAKPYAIGSYRNAATGIQLTEQGYHIVFAGEDEENPRLLINKRIDYWIVSELHGMYIAAQQGFAKDIVPAIKYKNIELNMLCNVHMDKQRIELFNKINKNIDNDGTMDKILRKNGIK
ncbi:substrate-binding periplasmic protein [Undibacterium sp. Dicai25W]|uniref:substrate-binding periplasmic protein n=1 Tax=Undibacterium sp. Dicai25W TaxID=3413034 RepID=UPI003BF03DB3